MSDRTAKNLIKETHRNVIEPVNSALSGPPQEITPFKSFPVIEGANKMPISREEMVPWANKLSTTVGMVLVVAGDNVPRVRSTGPILSTPKGNVSDA